jgi:hypothetical protein
MAEPRLKSRLRVQAMLREATLHGSFGAVLHTGDPDAGAILVVLRGREGLTVLSETRRPDGTQAWLRATGPNAVDQPSADTYVARRRLHDQDAWVVEFDSPMLTPPFTASVLD